MADLNHFDSSTQAPLVKQLRVRKGAQAETLTGAVTLTARSANWISLEPNGATKVVTLPAEADSEGLVFHLYNAGGVGEDLTVKNPAAATVATVTPGGAGVFGCDGAAWFVLGNA